MTSTDGMERPVAQTCPATDEIEAFLFHEARLLDDRRYDDWVDLFSADGRYWVPCNEPAADPRRHVQIIYDDVPALRARVARLTSGKQYMQEPPSRTCRLVSNVYLGDEPAAQDAAGDALSVHSAFVLVEARRHHRKNFYAGKCTHRLVRVGSGFAIVEKRVDLVDSDHYYEDLTFLP